jgi:hypothetical protein
VIEENGVRLKLNVIDTPGFGDQVNNENWCERDDFAVPSMATDACGQLGDHHPIHP